MYYPPEFFDNKKMIDAMRDIILLYKYKSYTDLTTENINYLISVAITCIDLDDLFLLLEENTDSFVNELGSSLITANANHVFNCMQKGLVEYFSPHFKELFSEIVDSLAIDDKMESGYRKITDKQTGEPIWVKIF